MLLYKIRRFLQMKSTAMKLINTFRNLIFIISLRRCHRILQIYRETRGTPSLSFINVLFGSNFLFVWRNEICFFTFYFVCVFLGRRMIQVLQTLRNCIWQLILIRISFGQKLLIYIKAFLIFRGFTYINFWLDLRVLYVYFNIIYSVFTVIMLIHVLKFPLIFGLFQILIHF